ncbi:had-superfamily subfamily variant 1 [Fusarium mexicanum]|uniref:Had-superfamily subfamily variant 1 n=1 Tax=Fusarium mexicanum TaxID=751941 RepID=A0A8H5N2E0_9HYPO|nr:had-superfamily subfamily variant 1 [Fusarium mexicanum]
MSSQPSSSKEAMANYPRPPPRPPEKPKRDLQSRKVIFFTLDTLFNRNYAIECALERCRQVNPDLASKTLEELKRGYRDAMAEAYRRLIHTRLHGSGPAVFPPNSTPQVLNDKVGMMFQQLNLNPPSASERKRIGGEFGAAFNRNRFETHGASRTLLRLQHLEYTIVVVDEALDWDVVKDLNFSQYIDDKIISEELVVRKPDPRVFQKALNAYSIPPNNCIIVGCSIEEDVVGILNAGADAILYMPGYHHTAMDVKGTRVLVVRTMAELLWEIKRRPENSHLVPLQQQQQVPPVPYPIHPQMVYAPQNQGHSNDQNHQPSSQSHHPPSDPKPVEDGHAGQSRKRPRPSATLSRPVTSNETPRNHRLPDRDHSSRDYEGNVRPTPPLSPSTSTRTYSPRAPTPARELERPNGDGPDRSCPTNSPLAHRPRSPSPPRTLPPMRMYPPTEEDVISRPANVENLYQSRSPHEGYGHGASRERHTTQAGYPPPPGPPRSPYRPPIPAHVRNHDRGRSQQDCDRYETSVNRYATQSGCPPPPRSPHQPPTPIRGLYRDQGRSWHGVQEYEYETSGSRYTTQGRYPPETPIPYRTSSLRNAGHHDQERSRSPQRHYEVSSRVNSARDQYQVETASSYQAPDELRHRTHSHQIAPSRGLSGGRWRDKSPRRIATISEVSSHRPWETGNAEPVRERWEPPDQRRPPRQEERRVQPNPREAIDLTSPEVTVASPDSPVDRLSDGSSSMTLPEDQDIERRDGGSTTDSMSSTDTRTSQSSSSQSALPNDTVAGPSGQRQRTSQELREIAQSMLDLSRGRPRVSVGEVPKGGEDQGQQQMVK